MWFSLIPNPDRVDLRMAARVGAGYWRWAAPFLALGAVGADQWLVKNGYALSWTRFILPAAGLVLLDRMRRARPSAPCPRWRPREGWLPWWQVSLWTLLGAAGLMIPILVAIMHFKPELAPDPLDGAAFAAALFPMCVLAPLTEEGVYRWLLCTGLSTRLPPWVIVVLSGTMFAGLHIIYGNPAVTNLLAGYLLAWVYLASGSLLVPVLWHAGGNLLLLLLPGLFVA
jgi:membrane protease YdiL (CAAX protease family)